jgi:hypothetical protein
MARYIKYHLYGDYDTLPTTLPENIDAGFGDIVAFRSYRDTGTRFVGRRKQLINNPDYACSGYLSIPLEITKYYKNGYGHYKNIALDKERPCVSIDLRGKDPWIIQKYGEAMPSEWKITVWHNWGELGDIYIEFNKDTTESFNLDTPLNDIKIYASKLTEHRLTFYAWYNIFGEDNVNNWSEYVRQNKYKLPKTWKLRYCGGGAGMDHTYDQLKFYGPESDQLKAFDAVKEYYEGFNGKIDWTVTVPAINPRRLTGSYNDNGISRPIFQGDEHDEFSYLLEN